MNILALSSFIPTQICDTYRFTGYHGGQTIPHYCSYAADYISQVLEDPTIDGAVYPRSCDSCRAITGYLAGKTDKFLYQFAIPARRDNAAVTYLAAELRLYQQALEQHYQVQLTDIPQRIQAVNIRNQNIKNLYQDIKSISYKAYLDMIHTMLNKPLHEQTIPTSLPSKPTAGKPVYLVGSFLTDTEVVAQIEAAGLSIVGDNLTQSKRLFSAPATGAEGDIYENIAFSILNNQLSPTQNDFHGILKKDLTEIKQKSAQGVIFITQKYCEPYDYLYSVYKQMLDEEGIPTLKITLADSTAGNRRAETAIEAFADIL